MPTPTPSAFAKRLEIRKAILEEIIAALRGQTRISWGGGEMTSKHKILKELGITLVTKTRAKKLGYDVNPRAKPIGSVYFSAPISDYKEVYVLECQCYPRPERHVTKGEE